MSHVPLWPYGRSPRRVLSREHPPLHDASRYGYNLGRSADRLTGGCPIEVTAVLLALLRVMVQLSKRGHVTSGENFRERPLGA